MDQKTNFLAHFDRFFGYAHLRPTNYDPNFWQKKDFNKVHNGGKFHSYSVCGYQLINFQMFSYQSAFMKWPRFRFFFEPLLPQIMLITLKLSPKLVFEIRKTLLQRYLKYLNGGNGTYPMFTGLAHFWTQFTFGKPKILPKTKISSKTESLGILNNISDRSQKKRRTFVILI